MRQIIIALVFVSAVSQRAAAQAVETLRQGVHIEVRQVNGKPQTGTLMSLGNDSLVFATDPRATATGLRKSQTTSLAFADVKSVRVSRGQSKLGGILTKGLLGTGIGMLSGAIVGGATYTQQTSQTGWGCFMICSRGAAAAFVGGVGGAIGWIAGSIYGASHPNESWETVELPKR